jgi:hypothetical protein
MCTLGSAQLATQAERWRILYAEAGIRRTVIDAGLRVSFRPEPAVEEELRALAAIERECCRWASWRIDVTADELVLEVGSTGDGISVIHGWLFSEEPEMAAG